MPETRSLLERVMERVELRPFTLKSSTTAATVSAEPAHRGGGCRDRGIRGGGLDRDRQWVVRSHDDARRQAPRNPEGKTAEEVATDFVNEMVFYNTDLAIRHLANDAAVSRLGLDGIGEFRRWLSFNEAMGFQVKLTSCEKTVTSSLGRYVRCMFISISTASNPKRSDGGLIAAAIRLVDPCHPPRMGRSAMCRGIWRPRSSDLRCWTRSPRGVRDLPGGCRRDVHERQPPALQPQPGIDPALGATHP